MTTMRLTYRIRNNDGRTQAPGVQRGWHGRACSLRLATPSPSSSSDHQQHPLLLLLMVVKQLSPESSRPSSIRGCKQRTRRQL